MHAKGLALLGYNNNNPCGGGIWENMGRGVMGAIMELMNKFLRNQSIIELMAKFLNKLTMGPCNLKRGGTDQPSK